MNQNMYTPQPIDTTDFGLPEELEVVSEIIQKYIFEVWAEARIQQRIFTDRNFSR